MGKFVSEIDEMDAAEFDRWYYYFEMVQKAQNPKPKKTKDSKSHTEYF